MEDERHGPCVLDGYTVGNGLGRGGSSSYKMVSAVPSKFFVLG